MRIIFFGTPQFSAEILLYLIENKIDVIAVVSKPDKPRGRSGELIAPPVVETARKNLRNIPIFQPEKASSPDFIALLKTFPADLYVVVAYGEILKEAVLQLPKRACINVHASLLPKYRGAAPIQRAIIGGERETGITIMHMVLKMDAGGIIKQENTEVGPEETAGDLEKKLCHLSKSTLLEAIQDLKRGKVSEIAQDESKVTYAHKIELQDCQIDWNQSAEQIHNLVRGVNPSPGAWCWTLINGRQLRLKIWKTLQLPKENGAPGEILNFSNEKFIVACGTGALQLQQLQLEGKKAMNADEFVRGHLKQNFTFVLSF